MSPPKANKGKATAAVPPLDYSKKLRIVRAPKALASILASGSQHHTDTKQTTKEFNSISQRFQTQFPPIAQKTTIIKPQATTKENAQSDKLDIKVPQWKIVTPSTMKATKTNFPLLVNDKDENVSALMDQINYSNGHFYYEKGDERIEMSTETIAGILMKGTASMQAPRMDFTRSGTYIRYSMNKDVSSTTRAFGKDCISYSMRLEDYVFLLDLLKRNSTWSRPLTFSSIRWLLGQLLQPRNLPSLEPESDPDKLGRDQTVSRIRRKLEPCTNTGTYEDRRLISVTSTPVSSSGMTCGTVKDETKESSQMIPPTLTSMSISAITNYRRMMGPYITDEAFAYLINLFELMSGNKECIQIETAVAEARARLGVLTPTARILREVIDYWRSKRTAMGRSLLRDFWPVPSANDNSPFAVFRARTKEKMVLRRPRRSAPDSSTRCSRLAEEFVKTEDLFAASRYRDWIKLQMCDIDALLFEQLWKEHQDSNYKHPGWNAMKRDIEQELRSNKMSEATRTSASPLSLPVEKKTRSFSTATTASTTSSGTAFNVPMDIDGFGEDQISIEEQSSNDDGGISQRCSKRRRTSSDPTTAQQQQQQPQQQQPQQQQQSTSSMYYLGRSKKVAKRNREFYHPRQSDAPSRIHTTASLDRSEVFISPVPLPPIYLGLDPQCSQEELENALRSVGVTSMSPVGILEYNHQLSSSIQSVYKNTNPTPSSHLSLPPTATASDLLVSPMSRLPFPLEVFVLRRESPHSSQSYIYRQSLEFLPPRVKHPSNLRYIIPYGNPSDHFQQLLLQQSQTRSQPSSFPPQHLSHTPSLSPTDNLPSFGAVPMRTCIRIGRNGRAWLDRHPVILPTPHLLSNPPIDISFITQSKQQFHQSPNHSTLNPFSGVLQSKARWIKSLLASIYTIDKFSSHDLSEIKRTAGDLIESGNIPTLRCSDDSSLLIEPTSITSSDLPRYVPCLSVYGLTLESIDHSVRFVSSILPPLPDHHYGYGDSGFYPTGIGGPESSLLGSSLGDLEPGIAGPLGFDALSNAAGFNLFCLPRQSHHNRQEFWEDLFATKIVV